MARVLVIDDDQDIGWLVRRMVEARGHDVVVREDGLRGLAAAQRQRPDVIVLDLMMPVMDGHGVLDELRDDDRTRAIPVVVLTAVALTEAREHAERAGAARFITKPFEPDDLLDAIDALVAG
ncbi:MAG TPA: response regulator [Actinomycetota bacterium]